MPDLIEKFFDTFEIKPYETSSREYDSDGEICSYYVEYPEITDHILLELICILSEWRTYLQSSYTIKANNTLNLKQDVLKDFLELFKWYKFKKCENGIKQQIQELFKGE